MTRKEVVNLLIDEKILILEGGKYILATDYVPKTSKIDQNFENLLENYAALWPKGIKTGNRLIRRSANSLRRKLLAFTKLRPDITVDEILTATEIYLKSAKRQGWEYTISADYFISKNNSSELEAHADLVKEGNLKDPSDSNFVTSLN